MKNLFVSYEIAILLKEKGFNEPCFAWYYLPEGNLMGLGSQEALKFKNKGSKKHFCSAPLYQQVVDWFREKHLIKFIESEQFIPSEYNVWSIKQAGSFKKYGEWTLNEAIEEALKLI